MSSHESKDKYMMIYKLVNNRTSMVALNIVMVIKKLTRDMSLD